MEGCAVVNKVRARADLRAHFNPVLLSAPQPEGNLSSSAATRALVTTSPASAFEKKWEECQEYRTAAAQEGLWEAHTGRNLNPSEVTAKENLWMTFRHQGQTTVAYYNVNTEKAPVIALLTSEKNMPLIQLKLVMTMSHFVGLGPNCIHSPRHINKSKSFIWIHPVASFVHTEIVCLNSYPLSPILFMSIQK